MRSWRRIPCLSHLFKDTAKLKKNLILAPIVPFSSPLVMLLSFLMHTECLPLWADPFSPPPPPLSPPLSLIISGACEFRQHLVADLLRAERQLFLKLCFLSQGCTEDSPLQLRRSEVFQFLCALFEPFSTHLRWIWRNEPTTDVRLNICD